MLRGMKMLRGVLVFGRVAAADVSADEAHAEMHPAVSGLEAFFAAAGMRVDILNLVEVGTFASHEV
jgi:hypothetical protein